MPNLVSLIDVNSKKHRTLVRNCYGESGTFGHLTPVSLSVCFEQVFCLYLVFNLSNYLPGLSINYSSVWNYNIFNY